jgi:hypothetical protein
VAEIRVRLPILHPGQKLVAENAGRYNVLTCGRRWGKTKFGLHRLLTGPKNLLDPAGYPAGWFAPSSRYVDDVWDEILARLAGLVEYKNRQAGRMRFVTGSTLDFWAMGEDKEVARTVAQERWPHLATFYFGRKKDVGRADAALLGAFYLDR